MAGIKKRLGSLLGPQGIPGEDGTAPELVEGQTTQVAPGEPAKIELTKTGDTQYRVNAQIPRGLDGDPTAVANFGEAVATEVNTSGSTGRTALDDNFESFDVPASASELENATGVFVAAAVKAKAEGRKALRVAPGTYHVPALHPDDILDLFVVGDGVKLTGGRTQATTPNLYPVTFARWERMALGHRPITSTGRGRIAIEMDDAELPDWDMVFPVCADELDIPVSSAWHTGNGARWIYEAHRQGWEIMAHLPTNTRATDLSLQDLETIAKESYDAVRETTGQERVGFVYPQHARNLETDRVLSKYFDFGRGLPSIRPYNNDGSYREWLTSSYPLDEEFGKAGGELTLTLRELLHSIATSDVSMTMYMHFADRSELRLEAFKKFVKYAKSLGIVFTTSSHIVGGRGVLLDPYATEPGSFNYTGSFRRSTDHAYHGEASHLYDTASPVQSTVVSNFSVVPRRKPGMFAIYRGHFRLKTLGQVQFESGTARGINLTSRRYYHDQQGVTAFDSMGMSTPPLQEGLTIPVSDWDRYSSHIAVDPATDYMILGINVFGAQQGTANMWFDELQFEFVDFVDRLEYTVDLTSPDWATYSVKTEITHVKNLADQHIEVVQPHDFEEEVYVESIALNRFTLRSPSPNDVGPVKVIIRPRQTAYPSLDFPSTGA